MRRFRVDTNLGKGVEVYSRKVAKQKLDYIHFNLVTGKWKLAKDDINYHFSSAKIL